MKNRMFDIRYQDGQWMVLLGEAPSSESEGLEEYWTPLEGWAPQQPEFCTWHGFNSLTQGAL